MAYHRMNCRRSGVRPAPTETGPDPGPVARTQSIEEGTSGDVDILPKPDGFGTEASTSSTSFELIDEYQVPAKSIARMGEISMSIQSNGEAKASVAGTTYGPFTGSLDVSVPLDDAVLPAEYQVRVHHKSTDGNSTTTKAIVVALEV